MRKLPWVIACLLLLAVLFIPFSSESAAQANTAQSAVYEVASVTPSAPDVSGVGQTDISGNRFVGKNLSVRQMVYTAYGIYGVGIDDFTSNVPEWASSARFDIQARLENETVHQSELVRSREIMRALLADRFQFKSHYEKQDRRVYVLVVDKHGSKVQQATGADQPEMSVMRGNIHLRAATMAPFAQGISLLLGRPVIDETGLAGKYNIDFKCAVDELGDPGDESASLPTLLREQLGLRLLPTKRPVDVLVIDRLERPSSN